MRKDNLLTINCRFPLMTMGCMVFAAMLCSMAANPLRACPIPVFRYSVEYWEPDPYRITVFHRNGVPAEHTEALELLRQAMTGGDDVEKANLALNLVNVEEQPYAINRFLEAQQLSAEGGGVELPWMVVQYAAIERRDQPIWRGSLTLETVKRLLLSPAREKAAAKMADGIPVWLLLESGDRRLDNRVYALLTGELERLEQTLQLPDPEQWWDKRGGAPAPKITFAAMRVSRDDPAETFFINMLMNSENDLHDHASQPMVFPLYGRGMALWALIGDGINPGTITAAAEHLAGPCSCQVKMLNRGVDILIAKNWADSVKIISDQLLAPVAGTANFEARGLEVERRLAAEADKTARRHDSTAPSSWGATQAAAQEDPEAIIDALADRLAARQAEAPVGKASVAWWIISLGFVGLTAALIMTKVVRFKCTGENAGPKDVE